MSSIKKTKKTVFCEDCKNFDEMKNGCIVGTVNTPVRKENVLGNCTIFNKGNNCKKWKQKIPF